MSEKSDQPENTNDAACNEIDTKSKIEHAKAVYEKNKEIYKYTYENMKTLDSKITRSVGLITFMFTVQTGVITAVLPRVSNQFVGGSLLTLAIITYVTLITSLIWAINLASPKWRSAYVTDQDSTRYDNNLIASGVDGTLQFYVNISHTTATVCHELHTSNVTIGTSLIKIHWAVAMAYIFVGISALIACFFTSF